MSEIELAPLTDTLDDDELKALQKQLDQAGTKWTAGDDGITQSIAKRLSEDAMTEFLDRLDAHDIAADIYLPVEFDGRLQVGDYRIASGHALVDVLDEIKDELDVEDEEEEESDEEDEEEKDDDDPEEAKVIEAQLRHIWQLVTDACQESLEKNLPLHLRV